MRLQAPECYREVFKLTRKPAVNRTEIKLFTIYFQRDMYHPASISLIDCSNIPLWLLLFLLVVYLVVLKRPNITGFLLSRVCSKNTSSVKVQCNVIVKNLLFSACQKKIHRLLKHNPILLIYSF